METMTIKKFRMPDDSLWMFKRERSDSTDFFVHGGERGYPTLPFRYCEYIGTAFRFAVDAENRFWVSEAVGGANHVMHSPSEHECIFKIMRKFKEHLYETARYDTCGQTSSPKLIAKRTGMWRWAFEEPFAVPAASVSQIRSAIKTNSQIMAAPSASQLRPKIS